MAIERIKLNLIPIGKMPVCHASQYDKGRRIALDIYNGLQPYILSDEMLELDIRKSDGRIVTLDVPITARGNSVVFSTTEQMCAVAGANLCELKITKGADVIGSLNFYMEIERSPMENGLQSDSEINNLTTQIEGILDPMLDEKIPPVVEEILPQIIGDNYPTKTEVEEALANKANSNDVYDKQTIDAAFDSVNNALANKADSANVYSKNEVDNVLATKANSSDVYTKNQVDEALANKANTDSVNEQFDDVNEKLDTVVPVNIAEGVMLSSGKAVNYSTGVLQTSTVFSATAFIDITGISKLYYKKLVTTSTSTPQTGMAFYNNAYEYISGERIGYRADALKYNFAEVDVPVGAKYARFTMSETLIDPFKVYGVAQFEAASQTKIAVLDEKSEAFDVLVPENIGKTNWYDNWYIEYNTGNVHTTTTLKVTDFIDISGHDELIYTRLFLTSSSSEAGIAFYDSSKAFISGERASLSASTNHVELSRITVPAGAVYLRATFYKEGSTAITIPFGVFDAAQYDNSLLVKFNNVENDLVKEATALGLHTMPENRGVLNLIKRCRKMTDIKWTPAVDLPRFMYESTIPPYDEDYDDDMALHYIGKFEAGKEYTGVPYGRCDFLDDYGYNYSYVGLNVGFDVFATSVANPQSFVSIESVGDVADHKSIPFAAVCSSLTCYALNKSYVPTSDIPLIDGLNLVTSLKVDNDYIDPNIIKLGDILNLQSHHTVVITDLVKDENGNVIFIEESEATTVGNGNKDVEGGQTGGLCRRVGFDIESFFARFGDYSLYRYDKIANIPYTPSKYVNVGNELNMARLLDLPVIPYMGEGFKYKAGYLHNTTLAIASTYYNKLRVFKDGTEIAGSPFTVPANATSVDVGFSEVGNYEAYLCKMSGGVNTKVSAKCHWSVT